MFPENQYTGRRVEHGWLVFWFWPRSPLLQHRVGFYCFADLSDRWFVCRYDLCYTGPVKRNRRL